MWTIIYNGKLATLVAIMVKTRITCTYITPLGCLHMQSNISKKTKNNKKTNNQKFKKSYRKDKSLALAYLSKMDVKK